MNTRQLKALLTWSGLDKNFDWDSDRAESFFDGRAVCKSASFTRLNRRKSIFWNNSLRTLNTFELAGSDLSVCYYLNLNFCDV